MPTFIGYPPDAIANLTNPGNELTTGDSFQLDPSFTFANDGVTFVITDDDNLFEGDSVDGEVGDDTTQSAQVYDAAGNLTSSGQAYLEDAFEFTIDGEHVELYRVEIAGVHVGWATTAPLAPGDTYTVDNEDNINEYHTVEYSSLHVCYAPNTLIQTPDGPRAVETLCPGDLVMTVDHGPQPIRWTRSNDHPLDGVEAEGKPVLIQAGALGPERPAQDLIVSPQHRILVGTGEQLTQYFDSEVFVPAKALTRLPGIRHMKGKREITWIHFACDRHEVVTANGCQSESLLLGPLVRRGLTRAEHRYLTRIFGSIRMPGDSLNGPAARACEPVGKVRRTLAKKLKEKKNRPAKHGHVRDADLTMEAYGVGRSRDAARPRHGAAA